METLQQNIALRPRFQIELNNQNEFFLRQFEKTIDSPIVIKRLDDHVFLTFPAKKKTFWSPQLHLEIRAIDANTSRIYGVFGPNPTLWTFFMFLHFGVATLFLILGVWTYSSATLGRPYGIQLLLLLLTVILWFLLYAFGRAGRHKGKPQMQELFDFMHRVLGQ